MKKEQTKTECLAMTQGQISMLRRRWERVEVWLEKARRPGEPRLLSKGFARGIVERCVDEYFDMIDDIAFGGPKTDQDAP